MDEMSNRSDERIAAMAPVHSNDQNPTEIVNKDDHSYLEEEGRNKNPRSWQECQHRENLRIQTMMLSSTVTSGRDKCETSSLEEKYTDMIIVAPIRERSLIENELNSRGEERERMLTESIKNVHQVQIDQLLRSGSETDKFGTTVVFGAAGIGKSTLLQKIIHDWANGRIYQEFKFVFQLNFPQLNSINVKTNLNTLILNSYPYLASKLEYIWEDPGSILFIFDDLDKFDSGVDFIDLERCKDPQNQCFDTNSLHWVSDIARCLIQGYLLHGCSILVTSRPWKMGNLTKTKINLRGEILGFTSKSIKQYFRQCFADEQLATSVLESIQQNETLYTMCYNPLYCAVLSSLLTTRLKEREKQGPLLVPNSTEMFSAYITELLARCHCDERNLCSQLMKLGEVAWKGVSSKTIVFDSDQINQHKLEDSNFISSFMREIGESHRFAYTFNQSVLQDFIAAVAKCLTTSSKGLIRQLDEGFTCSDNRFEIFSRFLIGLLSHNSNNQLEKLLADFPSEATQLVSVWLRDNIRRRIQKTGDMQSQRIFLQLMHCFVEFQDKALISDSFQPPQLITFTQCLLKPSDCAALATSFVYMEQIEDLNLSACGIKDGGVHQLEPILSKCKILRLKSNNLTDDCVEGLVSILSENGSLLELDLSNDNHDEEQINKLTEKCIPSLHHLIKCKNNIKEIRLIRNHGIAEDHQVLNSNHLFNLLTDQDKNSPMEILHNHDTDSKDSTHVITEAENPGLQENKHHGNSNHDCATVEDNVAAAPIESSMAGPELSKDTARQQGSPSENGEESVNNMRPNQFQQNAVNDREFEQEENAHMETIFPGDSSNEDVSPTNNMFEQVPLGLEDNCEHPNDRNTSGPEGDNNVNMATLATVADVQQSKDGALQLDNTFKIKEDMDENKEENSMTDILQCKDNCNDIKPMTETHAESVRQPHPNGAHEKGKDVSENDNEEDANLSTGDDIPQSKDAEQQQNNPLEISTEDVCKNKVEYGVTEMRCSKDNCNDIKPTDAANAYSTPQLHRNRAHENGKNVSEAGIQQSRDAELQRDKLLENSKEDVDKNKEKNIVSETTDICIKSRNSMNGDSAPQPYSNGDNENNIHAQAFASPVLHGDSTDPHMYKESTNMTTDSASLLHNRESQDSVNIQSPQKPLQEELQVCRQGHVKAIIPLFSTATPQQELGNVKSTPTCPSPVRNPRPSGLLQEENISIGGPSINMLPDGMSIPFSTAVKAKGPGAVENSDNGPASPVLHGDSTDAHVCEEFRNMTTDSASLLHNGETQDSVNIQSPQKPLQDELQGCRQGHVKAIIPLFSTATPQQELGNVKSTPTCPSPVRNPRPSGILQEENISIGGPSINMLPDGMSIPCGTAVKAKGPGAVENSDNRPESPVLHGDSKDAHMCEEFRNMTTDSESLLHNGETQDSVNIQSPQKPLQDELQVFQ
ncbi:uncharacterized protein [Chiloscyllium punctatum]|uniref:uncharacterized protein n=1 Tax=Chiloscyllium punctatum TaxID=137246 RepID=UPI003B63B14D